MEKNLTERESLAIITTMIAQTRNNYQKGGSFHFLLWGWVIMLANFGHYLLDTVVAYEQPYLVWLITFPAAIISGIYGYKQGKDAIVIGHMDRLYGHVWIACGVGILSSLIFMRELNYGHEPVILLFAAVGTYITGQMLRFRPLIFGGLALVLAAIACFSVPVSNQYLVSGIGMFAGYLVPGYMLKKREK